MINDADAKHFVSSDLFDHLFEYTKKLSEIADSLYLELDDLKKRVHELGESSNG
jgi:hypothetical protein